MSTMRTYNDSSTWSINRSHTKTLESLESCSLPRYPSRMEMTMPKHGARRAFAVQLTQFSNSIHCCGMSKCALVGSMCDQKLRRLRRTCARQRSSDPHMIGSVDSNGASECDSAADAISSISPRLMTTP